MAKITISTKQKKSSQTTQIGASRINLKKHDVFAAHLKDPKLVKEILVEALMTNDLDVFQDVLVAYLRTTSKSKLSAKTKLGRQTLYDLIDEKKEFNPTLSTLASILKSIAT
jgi:DNA-binding phage protein